MTDKRSKTAGPRARGQVRVATAALRSHHRDVSRQHSVIARAKLEWESAVDGVPELICLLDRQGLVIRVNRSIERWGLGALRSSLGVNMHRLLHPRCKSRSCALQKPLRRFWSEIRMSGLASMQIKDGAKGKVLRFEAKSIALNSVPSKRSVKNCVLLIVGDVTQLVHAQEESRNLNQQLELRVMARTLELEQVNSTLRAEIERRQDAEAELRDASVELSELSMQLMRAQELERQRIALELHDSIGQSLSAIKYTLEHAAQLTGAAAVGDRDRRLTLAIGQVQRVIAEVRAISTNLRPTALDDLGVVSALRALCREWAEVYQGIELTVNIGLEDADVPEALRTSAFRIIQEALNNVAQHSAATCAWVSIHRAPEGVVVEVADNGRGIDSDRKPAHSSRGMGLRGLRERAAHHGGKLEVVSSPGNGTLLRICWPQIEDRQLPGKVA